MKFKRVLYTFALSSLFLPVSAAGLSAQGANLSNCAASLGERYSTEEAYRLCKLRRSRSLLYKGSAACPGGASPTAPSACHPEDSAGQFTDNAHEPSATLQPVMSGDLASVYGDRQFTYQGKTYRIDQSGNVQIYQSRRWIFRCRLKLDELGCIYEQGSNSAQNRRSDRVACGYDYLRFEPNLFRMKVTKGESRKTYRVQQVPGNVSYTWYHCVIDARTSALVWR